MDTYANSSPALLLQILILKSELQRIRIEKNNAVIRQRYELGSEKRQEENNLKEKLGSIELRLKHDFQDLPFLPGNLIELVHINRLLAEFGKHDSELVVKINTLIVYFKAARLDAINHNRKDSAHAFSLELKLTSDALAEYIRLNK
jgi:hypothetical protein